MSWFNSHPLVGSVKAKTGSPFLLYSLLAKATDFRNVWEFIEDLTRWKLVPRNWLVVLGIRKQKLGLAERRPWERRSKETAGIQWYRGGWERRHVYSRLYKLLISSFIHSLLINVHWVSTVSQTQSLPSCVLYSKGGIKLIYLVVELDIQSQSLNGW